MPRPIGRTCKSGIVSDRAVLPGGAGQGDDLGANGLEPRRRGEPPQGRTGHQVLKGGGPPCPLSGNLDNDMAELGDGSPAWTRRRLRITPAPFPVETVR
jgi:hypothetical protein